MSNMQELWVERAKLDHIKQTSEPTPDINENEVLVKIDKFGLTANNVSYAVSGDVIGYWKFFPAENEYGKVPVWGFADVISSRHNSIKQGERIWGFFPMASHVVLQPTAIRDNGFTDGANHRQPLPALYNQYTRTHNEPASMRAAEDARCVFFPLFMTSYILYDYLTDNKFFGAEQVIIASASSKTAFGLAHLLHHDSAVNTRIIGLTSAGNAGFVEALGVYDVVVPYGEETGLDAVTKTAFVDMSGDGPLIERLHHHFADNMVESAIVGATHWQEERRARGVPGAKPTFFFAPAQIAKRDKEWGQGVALRKGTEACLAIAESVADIVKIEHIAGVDALEAIWRSLIVNEVSPQRGLVVSL